MTSSPRLPLAPLLKAGSSGGGRGMRVEPNSM
jgi:acetyl/propionyl-CoA carboxylase alpha subunit